MLFAWKSRGFTLIETLTTLAVLAVGLALALPAVQAAREDARYAACRNNLKQIGQALHQYRQVNNKVIPCGWDSETQFGWSVGLLPYLNQKDLYLKLKAERTADRKSANVQSIVPVFRCNADTGSGLALGMSRSNYAGVIVGKPSLATATSTHGGGTFGMNSKRFPQSFRDGPFTILVGERMSTSKVSGKLRGTEGTWVGPNPGEIAIVGSTSLGAPNSTTYGAFGSSHPAGALFLFFDGEVRPIGANVDPKTFDALATTSGDDIVGDF